MAQKHPCAHIDCGSSGANSLVGGAGTDTLSGGSGNGTLLGGVGHGTPVELTAAALARAIA